MELKDLYAQYGELTIQAEYIQAKMAEVKRQIIKELKEKEKAK